MSTPNGFPCMAMILGRPFPDAPKYRDAKGRFRRETEQERYDRIGDNGRAWLAARYAFYKQYIESDPWTELFNGMKKGVQP